MILQFFFDQVVYNMLSVFYPTRSVLISEVLSNTGQITVRSVLVCSRRGLCVST